MITFKFCFSFQITFRNIYYRKLISMNSESNICLPCCTKPSVTKKTFLKYGNVIKKAFYNCSQYSKYSIFNVVIT